MKLQIPDNIKAITPYPPGKPIEELEREYGLSGSIKLASNENPLGPSPLAVRAMRSALTGVHRYPDGSGYYLTQKLAEKFGVKPEQVVLGNGSNEIIEFLVKGFVSAGEEIITSHPSFLMYQKFVQVRGGENFIVPLKDMRHDLETILELISEKTRLIFLDNPNNPCGTILSPNEFYRFLSEVPEHVVVVIDEAYIDFMADEYKVDVYSLINNCEKRCGVVFMRTMSKAYGLAGIRLGFGIMNEEIAEVLHKVRQPFNVSILALAAGLAALDDEDFYEKTLTTTRDGKAFLQQELTQMGCRTFDSQTNFFLIDINGDADSVYQAMLRKGVIIRSMKAYGFPQYVRINVGTENENKRFLASLQESLVECGYA
ncbi:MAG: histidinol-phosphate transaminase [Desulfobulbaceae bacterium]|nr:MAG: histidinol-phosphate transaminase [Desulfobulbaceae bacterium]